MASKPTSITKRSTSSAFSRSRAKATSRHLTSEVIAADVAAFKKRGGRIEVLGNTPLRSHLAATAFHSDVKSKREAATAAAAGNSARG